MSATGKGHGTERASLAGLIGQEPATVDPLFLDAMKAKPDEKYPLKRPDRDSASRSDLATPEGIGWKWRFTM